MGFSYAIIGAGMQGTAAAYDLARFGHAQRVHLFDADPARAQAAAERVNHLVGRAAASGSALDARDGARVRAALDGFSACLSAVPYFLNVDLARAVIQAGAHFNDLGGNTEVVERELALHPEAVARGISVVPDCGVAPGMANTLAVYGMGSLDHARHVHVRCGGLPANRALPLGYKKLFVLEGLTNEYTGKAVALREGRIVHLDTFEELERLDLPEPVGQVEAFTTSGGTSTCPRSFAGRLETYDYKTIRYPGHYAALKVFRDAGFFSTEPVRVRGQPVVPREVFHAVMDRLWDRPEEPDLLVLSVEVQGDKEGRPACFRALIIDRQDPRTGFTAMERTTAFPAAIVTALQAHGKVAPGAIPLERSVNAKDFVAELRRRDIPCELGVR